MSAREDKKRFFSWEQAAGPFFLILALLVFLTYQAKARHREEIALDAPLPASAHSEAAIASVHEPDPTAAPKEGTDDPAKAPAPSPSLSLVININTATLDELVSLPAIGEVKAQAILDYRMKNGPFKSLEALLEVKGIGEKTLEKLRDQITVK